MAFRTNKQPVLQEKSASGAVATFNTALAMPLPSCNIAVNAWQEGSGDPSPSNVRPIHGFSEVNLTANNAIYTIQLGQEVYGAEVDVVNGVAHVTWGIVNLADVQWTSFVGIRKTTDISNIKYVQQNTQLGNGMSERYKMHTGSGMSRATNCIAIDTAQVSVNSPNEQPQGLFAYELATPFDIQLTPTQIETLIGNNTIFADTGDVDLTFKDLDIAKRGNFREVFKLPS